jgi:hypothetical protein
MPASRRMWLMKLTVSASDIVDLSVELREFETDGNSISWRKSFGHFKLLAVKLRIVERGTGDLLDLHD